MGDTPGRLLTLLSLLQTPREWPGSELASRLEVSLRTIRRDVDRLRELGYPVDAQLGVDGGYQLAAGAALPPLVVDDEEAVALAVGMQAAVNGAVTGIEESAVRALTKVVQVMPPRLRRRVDALRAVTVPALWSSSSPAPAVDHEVLIAAAQACRDSERLRFGYSAPDAEPTRRHVEPHRLVSLGRRWYLVAYDLDRHAWRSFRLDRLTDPRGTGARFRTRELPAGDAAEFVRAGMRRLHSSIDVEVLVHAPAGTVQDKVGRWATIEALDERRCLLRMSVDSLDWPLLAVGSLGAEFEVHSPPELATLVRDWAARFTRAVSPGRAGASR